MGEDNLLFDEKLLSQAPRNDRPVLEQFFSTTGADRGLVLRPLAIDDINKGFLDLLGTLTRVGTVSSELFARRFNEMRACANTYYIIVIEDTMKNQIVATGALEVEQKFIHSAALRGRIEDIAVLPEYERQLNLREVILDMLTLLSKSLGCYKVSLESEDYRLDMYKKFGYKIEENFMCLRFHD